MEANKKAGVPVLLTLNIHKSLCENSKEARIAKFQCVLSSIERLSLIIEHKKLAQSSTFLIKRTELEHSAFLNYSNEILQIIRKALSPYMVVQ